jgi:hypothetical protein
VVAVEHEHVILIRFVLFHDIRKDLPHTVFALGILQLTNNDGLSENECFVFAGSNLVYTGGI